ncbi:DUF2975 domain-containing protein [Providencia rettgeri]|uniref:DUF2975 domain-containing protein n=1 Tax=Providencia rettgeri TaxID=587 RepID=UPI00101115D8|nr:DUF2975 domain-containing protein [Providencia rettgeri]RXN69657.1 DUF2975 domain-containing protein [Providencia rettgeri]
MNNISHSYKVQIKLCRVMEFSLIFLMFLLPLSCAYCLLLPRFYDDSLPIDAIVVEWTSADNIYFIVDNLIIFFVLFQMYIFCKGVRQGQLFTSERIKNIKYIGLFIVIGYILKLFIRAFFESSIDELNTDYILVFSNELDSFQELLLGGGLLSLSYIFDKGRELKEESELVI